MIIYYTTSPKSLKQNHLVFSNSPHAVAGTVPEALFVSARIVLLQARGAYLQNFIE